MSLWGFAESELLPLARRGDRAAFGELVRRDLPLALSQAAGCAGNREDAWDIAQEAYRKAWTAMPSFHGESRFSSWRYTILYRTFLDLRRARGRRRETDEDLSLRPDPAGGPETAALEKSSREETVRRVRSALARLNPLQRVLLKLVDMRRPRARAPRPERRPSRYAVVLRYLRVLLACPALTGAIPYREGLDRRALRRLQAEIQSRNAYDLKLLRARQAFVKRLLPERRGDQAGQP